MTAASVLEARRLVDALRRREREELEHEHERRRAALDGVRDALQAISEAPTPAALIERAPAELGSRTPLARVLLSTIRDDTLTDFRVWSRPSEGDPADWAEVTVALAYPLVEAELLRHGDAEVVDVARSRGRTPAVLHERLGWERYVAGAVALNGRPRWMLHAEVEPTKEGHEAGALEAEVVATYAAGLGRMIEIAFLRRLLLAFRNEQLRAARSVIDRLESTDPLSPPPAVDRPEPVLEELTPRERQVVELLIKGMTNAAIAEQLLVSEGTVKYHVANVLSKLGAGSRADAVARFLRRGQA